MGYARALKKRTRGTGKNMKNSVRREKTMSDIKYDGILLIDEALQPAVTLQEANALKPLQKQFMESYIASRDTADVREWLRQEMAHSLPEYDSADTERMADEIIDTLQLQEEKRDSLRRATQNGRSREGWFSSELKRAASQMTTQQSVQYLQTLDQTVKQANQALTDTIHTQTGAVSNNPSLDGFIAEQKACAVVQHECDRKGQSVPRQGAGTDRTRICEKFGRCRYRGRQ